MLIGHLGFGMGLKVWAARGAGQSREAKSAMPGDGLAPWFAAVLFADLAFFTLSFADIETFRYEPGFTRSFPYRALHAPFTHSCLGAAALGAVVGLLWWLYRRRLGQTRALVRVAVALGVGVFSHFPLDWLVHGPDMAWAFEPPSLGLSLWNYPAISETIEVLLLAVGAWLVVRADPRLKQWRFGTMLGILLVANRLPSMLPPIPNPTTAALSGLFSMSALVLIGWWGGRTLPSRRRVSG